MDIFTTIINTTVGALTGKVLGWFSKPDKNPESSIKKSSGNKSHNIDLEVPGDENIIIIGDNNTVDKNKKQ